MMPRTRTLPVVPGLARLLADVPRDRLIALATRWGVDRPDQPGVVAALYHRMTESGVVFRVLAELAESERLAFERLRSKPRGASQADLLRALPFSEGGLATLLRALEARGLVWKLAPGGRDEAAVGVRWLVARDLAAVAEPRPWVQRGRSAPAVARASSPLSPLPTMAPLPKAPGNPIESDRVVRVVDKLAEVASGPLTPTGRRGDPVVEDYATHCATALGVISANGHRFEGGPRRDAWIRLAHVDKVRALARLWRVDEGAPIPVREAVRQCLVETLAAAACNAWYDVDDVARAVAAARGGQTASPTFAEPEQLTGPSPTVSRRDVERGLIALAWLGVVDLAVDARERPVAVRVGEAGRHALA
jgi:hypothetical protein